MTFKASPLVLAKAQVSPPYGLRVPLPPPVAGSAISRKASARGRVKSEECPPPANAILKSTKRNRRDV
jgi:hypothetical protein